MMIDISKINNEKYLSKKIYKAFYEAEEAVSIIENMIYYWENNEE